MSILRQPGDEAKGLPKDGHDGHTQISALHEVQEAIHCEEEVNDEMERLNH